MALKTSGWFVWNKLNLIKSNTKAIYALSKAEYSSEPTWVPEDPVTHTGQVTLFNFCSGSSNNTSENVHNQR